jgi:hypothetical protein
MENTYTTKVSVTESGFVEIEIYSFSDGRFLTTYDFPLSEIKFYMETQLPGKAWFTLETMMSIIEEVRGLIKPSNHYGNW